MEKRIKRILRISTELELLHLKDPIKFEETMLNLLDFEKNNLLLSAWIQKIKEKKKKPTEKKLSFVITVILGLVTSILIREIFSFNSYSSLDLSFRLGFALFAIGFSFLIMSLRKQNIKVTKLVLIAIGFFILFFIFIPEIEFSKTDILKNDLWMLSFFHIPFIIWSLVGCLYISNSIYIPQVRINFIEFNGNLLITYLATMVIGIVLTLIALSLYSIIGLEIRNAEAWIATVGSIFSFFVSGFIAELYFNDLRKLLPFLLKSFSVLTLIFLLIFIFYLLGTIHSLFDTKSNLIVLNLFSIFTIFLMTFLISDDTRIGRYHFLDWILVAILLFSFSLSSISLVGGIIWIAEKGFSPFRFDSVIFNLLILANISLLIKNYFQIYQRKNDFSSLKKTQASFLLVYSFYAVSVTIGFAIVAFFI
jgi:hypothetical protein